MKLLKEIFKELDADGSGTVTPKEFNTQIKKKHIQEKLYKYFGTRTMNQMVEAWKTMDADGSRSDTSDRGGGKGYCMLRKMPFWLRSFVSVLRQKRSARAHKPSEALRRS